MDGTCDTGLTGAHCRRCNQDLPGDAFYPSSLKLKTQAGVSTCRVCLKVQLDREKARQNQIRFRERHPEARVEEQAETRAKRHYDRVSNPNAYFRRQFDKLLRQKYDMTLEQWETLFESQGKRCACCRRSASGFAKRGGLYPGWHTDHCHVTGVVRGILCGHCNLGIGHFFDNPDLVENASRYLRPSSGVDEHY